MDANQRFEQKVRRAFDETDDSLVVSVTEQTIVSDAFCDTCRWEDVWIDVSVGTRHFNRFKGLVEFLDWLDASEEEVPDGAVLVLPYDYF